VSTEGESPRQYASIKEVVKDLIDTNGNPDPEILAPPGMHWVTVHMPDNWPWRKTMRVLAYDDPSREPDIRAILSASPIKDQMTEEEKRWWADRTHYTSGSVETRPGCCCCVVRTEPQPEHKDEP
jgi:hypothetical protein